MLRNLFEFWKSTKAWSAFLLSSASLAGASLGIAGISTYTFAQNKLEAVLGRNGQMINIYYNLDAREERLNANWNSTWYDYNGTKIKVSVPPDTENNSVQNHFVMSFPLPRKPIVVVNNSVVRVKSGDEK